MSPLITLYATLKELMEAATLLQSLDTRSQNADEQSVERERRITSDLKSTVSGRRHVNRVVLSEAFCSKV